MALPSLNFQAADPPVAPKRSTVLRKHGEKRVDDYYWLRR
jgi:protease II